VPDSRERGLVRFHRNGEARHRRDGPGLRASWPAPQLPARQVRPLRETAPRRAIDAGGNRDRVPDRGRVIPGLPSSRRSPSRERRRLEAPCLDLTRELIYTHSKSLFPTPSTTYPSPSLETLASSVILKVGVRSTSRVLERCTLQQPAQSMPQSRLLAEVYS